MKTEEGWVHLLSQELEPEYRVINASISGDTTQGGLSRLPRLIELKNPDYVIIELGGNDGLRGQSLRSMQNNLDQMINLCIEKDIVPILFKMRIPPNYGKRYATAFEKVFTDLTLKHTILMQSLLTLRALYLSQITSNQTAFIQQQKRKT